MLFRSENATPYRKRLVCLSFASPTVLAKAGSDMGQVYGIADFWARQIKVELGKTGCSDQNLVAGPVSVIGAVPYRKRHKFGVYDLAREVRFPAPYRLPRDQGLVVRVGNTAQDFEDPPTLGTRATFIAKGRFEDNGAPAILAAESADDIPPGQTAVLRSADLFNRGRRAILIDRLVLKDFQAYSIEAGVTYDTSGTRIGWNINPTAGAQWTPNNNFIPVGCLAPMSFVGRTEDFTGNYPRVYFYPQLTYLDPRQTLGIKLINESTRTIIIHVSLFSELEVR